MLMKVLFERLFELFRPNNREHYSRKSFIISSISVYRFRSFEFRSSFIDASVSEQKTTPKGIFFVSANGWGEAGLYISLDALAEQIFDIRLIGDIVVC